MWHLGIDLHRLTVVIAGVNDTGEAMRRHHYSLRRHRRHPADRGKARSRFAP